jgi:hypothetical protein
VKKKHFIFIIKKINKNKKHIKIRNKKDKSCLKNLKHEPNIVEITHLCIRHRVQTSKQGKQIKLTYNGALFLITSLLTDRKGLFMDEK